MISPFTRFPFRDGGFFCLVCYMIGGAGGVGLCGFVPGFRGGCVICGVCGDGIGVIRLRGKAGQLMLRCYDQ